VPKLTKKERSQILRSLSLMGQVGIGMSACIFIAVFFGWFLDSRLGTTPWLVIVFSLLGVVSAFKFLYDLSKRL